MQIHFFIPTIGFAIFGLISLWLYKRGWGMRYLGGPEFMVRPKKATRDHRLNLAVHTCIAFLAAISFFILIFYKEL
jgi:hypothetical protein